MRSERGFIIDARIPREKSRILGSPNRFKLAVGAFGSGESFNQWVFATGLPDDIQLQMLYAGEGTFWTDLKGFSETMLGRQVQEQRKPASPSPTPTR